MEKIVGKYRFTTGWIPHPTNGGLSAQTKTTWHVQEWRGNIDKWQTIYWSPFRQQALDKFNEVTT